MKKALKILIGLIIAVPLVTLLTIVGVFLVKDANDFKPTIVAQAKNAGINLDIQGDLSWSLIPLGLDIHQIQIKDQTLADFASAERVLASIDFWSLFSGAPKVQTVLLDGLNLNLIQRSASDNNWSNILPPKDQPATPETAEPQASEPSDNALNFLVESFQLINTRLRFESGPQDLLLTINPLNLTLSNITFDQSFPVSLNFSLTEDKNQLEVFSEINTQLLISKDLSRFELSGLDNRNRIKAPDFIQDELRVQLNADIEANTKTETINIPRLMLALNELKLNAESRIENYSSDLKVQASLEIPAFSLKELLAALKIKLPPMQAEDALEKLALSGNLSLEKQTLNVDKLKLQLDESTWTGSLSRVLAEQPALQATRVKLHGDKLNLDRYLPPAADTAVTNTALTEPPQSSAPEELLPLDTLRTLNMDITLIQDSLQIKNIETSNIELSLTAKDGRLAQSLKGKLYEGSYSLTNRLDAQSKTPRWNSTQNISNLNLEPLMTSLSIEALKEYGKITGMLNIQGDFNASGNQLTTLQESAKGSLAFDIAKGAFEGISLNALSCKGLALINKESIDTSSWPNATPFNTLKGSATLDSQRVATRFDIITAGIHADSQGQIDLSKTELDLRAALKVIGEPADQACRVNEKLKDIGIPVVCKGQFDTPPAQLCKLDTSRLGEMAKTLAVEEGKRKLNKEVDRALEKHLGDEEKAPVKSLLQKLLK
jgi:uncharacterized protein involved in outer membrane biogenesis